MSVPLLGSEEELQQFLKDNSGKLVVIDFFATWCRPCMMIAPKIVQMAKDFENAVFAKIDVDESEDLAGDYGVTAMPTFLFFKDGKKVGFFQGANEQKLREEITALL